MSRSSAYLVVLAHFLVFVPLGFMLEHQPWFTASLVVTASAFAVTGFIERRLAASRLSSYLRPSPELFWLALSVALATANACWVYWRVATDPNGLPWSSLLGLGVTLLLVWSNTRGRPAQQPSPSDLTEP